jgi:Holliday junction resolvasome RuvABC endonuclease subunit
MGVLGIDLSLTCPGFAVLDSEDDALLVTSQKTHSRGPARWNDIVQNFKTILDNHIVELAVFEGYGFNSMRLGDLAEIGGILRFVCYKRNIPYGAVPPTTLKKFFTGDGRAEKALMMRQAFNRGFKCANDNEADAVALACFGLSKDFTDLRSSWKPTSGQSKLKL